MRLSLILAASAAGVAAAEVPKKPDPLYTKVPAGQFDYNGINKMYMGRQIAHVMGHLGAGWLDRPERIREENPAKMYKALAIKPGTAVADIGAGSGFHTFRMSEQVGPKGTVYAVDIQPEMLAIIKKKAEQKGVENVRRVRGTVKDPKLPAGKLDLILMVDVYHEFNFPYEMTRKLIAALKPGGRLAFVEFRLEDPAVPIKLVHKMSRKQVRKEMAIHPEMEHAETITSLPWQHVIVFKKKADR